MADGPKRKTRSKTQKTINGTVYSESCGFSPGVLPASRDIVQGMIYLLRPDRAGKHARTVEDAARLLAYAVIEHWEYCSIYTIIIKHVHNKIKKIYEVFKQNANTRVDRRTEKWKVNMDKYNQDMEKLFDIFCKDEDARLKREEDTEVPMGPDEWIYLEDMRNERKMYCEDFVDNVWKAQMDLKVAKQQKVARAKQAKSAEENRVRKVAWKDVVLVGDKENNNQVDDQTEDVEFIPVPEQADDENDNNKKRKKIAEPATCATDPLPAEYQHIRHNINTVKPQFYQTVDKIKAELHCSSNQASGAIITTANGLFDRSWKSHDQDKFVIDLDTAPHVRQIRQTGQALTALCLSEIVEEMMADGGGVITYHDDGSRTQGVGGYSVQGITIKNKFRPLPTLPVASECRSNLAALKVAVLSIMAACNNDYTATDIYNAVSFKVTDSTSHNFEVDEIVAAELGTEHIPVHLLCHTHPALMFNRKIVEVCSKIEKEIGPDKIYSAFLVNATTSHDSVLEQYIDCTVRLVSSDFNHKSWNKSREFDIYLGEEKNKAKALKKERFNRFVFMSAVVLHHQDQVQEFLAKFDTITNTLACIVRAFEECEFLTILLTATAILGIHLVEPYLSVTYFDTPNYENLIITMRQLYEDLKTTPTEDLLDISRPAFKFVDSERFRRCMTWDKQVLKSVEAAIDQHRAKVISVLSLILPELAQGFFVQRGDVFGFGPFDLDSEKLVTRHDMTKLNQVPINNLDSERAVGSINHELSLRGATQLQAASDSLVKNRSFDLIELKPVGEYKNYIAKAKSVNLLVKNWKEKQLEMEKEGMGKKEIESLASEKRKVKDLDKLKSFSGPFTKPDEVDDYVSRMDITVKEKQDRLYTEVRYARDTTLSLPKKSELFRLKEKYKPLSVEKFAINLKVYLGKVSTNASATWEDFDRAVASLKK